MADNHYVILVHGTWATPVVGELHWARLDPASAPNFASLLNDHLRKLGLGPCVNRDAPGLKTLFMWSGDNDHRARVEGGQKLFQLIRAIEDRDPAARIHIVAHSHGGNVVLKALELYFINLKLFGTDDFGRRLQRRIRQTWPEPMAFGDDISPLIDEVRNEARLSAKGSSLDAQQIAGIAHLFAEQHRYRARLDQSRKAGFPVYETGDVFVMGAGTNRIGKIVFLGTPFIRKYWDAAAWRLQKRMWSFVDVSIFASSLGLLLYVVTLIVWALLWLSLGIESDWIAAPLFNPLQWRTVLLLAEVGLALAGGSILVASFFQSDNFNYYFDDVDFKLLHYDKVDKYPFPRAIPLSVLSIHAGVLDEAYVALSAAPIVYGLMYPRVDELIAPPPFAGQRATREYSSVSATVVRWLTVALVRIAVVPLLPFRKLGVRFLNSALLRVIESAGFGLPPAEFGSPGVIATNTLGNQQIEVSSTGTMSWINEVQWDVTKLLLVDARNEALAGKEDRGSAFAFLTDQVLRERRLAVSPLWQKVKPHLPEILHRYRHVPGMSEESLREQTQLMILTIEQKARQAIDSIGLSHSRYYANQRIIDAVGDFIVSGQAPIPPAGEPS